MTVRVSKFYVFVLLTLCSDDDISNKLLEVAHNTV
jgi:hypothetical protein